jgi:hypothetical protein
VDGAIAGFDMRRIRGRRPKIAEHGLHTQPRHALGLLRIADQRRHLVPTPDEGIKHGGTHVAGRACQEDFHGVPAHFS